MKMIKPSFEIIYPSRYRIDLGWLDIMKMMESAGRTAYKSSDNGGLNTLSFVSKLIERKHFAVLEFGDMIVRFITDRGVTHELVRHRLCSFVQESTRFCDYASDRFGNEVTFIEPFEWASWDEGRRQSYLELLSNSEVQYKYLIEAGASPQQARGILPNALKTEIVVKANIREWRHIFALRALGLTGAPHPDMKRIMLPLYEQCLKECPVLFGGIN